MRKVSKLDEILERKKCEHISGLMKLRQAKLDALEQKREVQKHIHTASMETSSAAVDALTLPLNQLREVIKYL